MELILLVNNTQEQIIHLIRVQRIHQGHKRLKIQK
jgi:hypothetical protein